MSYTAVRCHGCQEMTWRTPGGRYSVHYGLPGRDCPKSGRLIPPRKRTPKPNRGS